MRPSLPPPDDLIAAARETVGKLIIFARSMLVPQLGPPNLHSLRATLRSSIEPAEALLRRALHLLAARLPALVLPAAKPRAATLAPSTEHKAPHKVRTAKFRLFERAGGPARPAAAPPAPFRDARPRSEKPAPDLARFRSRFEARLAALQEACLNPEAAARRLQRQLARRTAKSPPLAPKPPPGLLRMRFDTYKTLYRDLHAAALATFPADTS